MEDNEISTSIEAPLSPHKGHKLSGSSGDLNYPGNFEVDKSDTNREGEQLFAPGKKINYSY